MRYWIAIQPTGNEKSLPQLGVRYRILVDLMRHFEITLHSFDCNIGSSFRLIFG